MHIRKLVAIATTVLLALFLAACSSNPSGVNPNNNNATPTTPDNNGSSAASDASTGSTDAQTLATPISLSDDLSANIGDLTFMLEGDIISLPMLTDDFLTFGYKKNSLSSKDLPLKETLEPGQHAVIKPEKNGKVVILSVANLSTNKITVGQSSLCSIEIQSEALCELPKGITMGVSTRDDIIAAYGEPTFSVPVSYKKADYSVYFNFSKDSDVVASITITMHAIDNSALVSY